VKAAEPAVKAAEPAVKAAESDQKTVIVRLVEMQGREAQAHLRWAWAVRRVQEVSPVEEPLRDLAFEPYGCDLSLGAHKVVTLKLTPA